MHTQTPHIATLHVAIDMQLWGAVGIPQECIVSDDSATGPPVTAERLSETELEEWSCTLCQIDSGGESAPVATAPTANTATAIARLRHLLLPPSALAFCAV